MVSVQLHLIEVTSGRPIKGLDEVTCKFSPDSIVSHVPILHLYGQSSNVLSVCLKVHQVYPSFHVEIEDGLVKSLMPGKQFLIIIFHVLYDNMLNLFWILEHP